METIDCWATEVVFQAIIRKKNHFQNFNNFVLVSQTLVRRKDDVLSGEHASVPALWTMLPAVNSEWEYVYKKQEISKFHIYLVFALYSIECRSKRIYKPFYFVFIHIWPFL